MSIGLMQERPPYVRFSNDTVEDRNASMECGRYVARDVAMANITPAGSKDVVVRNADEWLADVQERARKNPPEYNPEWARHFRESYQAWKEGNELPTYGTPIRTWPVLSPAQVKNLIAVKLLTVEDLAVANEEALKAIGMGARDMKAKAIAWLDQAKDSGVVAQQVAGMKTQLEDLETRLEERDALIAELTARLDATKPTKRRGAPSLAERAASLQNDRDVV